MENEIIFTEDPEREIWNTLLQFSYKANIKRYFNKQTFEIDDDIINKLIDNISGSILQAYEYYKAAKIANLQISPLLLYYGTTNLVYGLSNLKYGKIHEIKNHGMKIVLPESNELLGNTKIRFENKEFGGVHVFSRCLNSQFDLTQLGEWSLKEMLSSISELRNDYLTCYNEITSKTLPVEKYKTPNGIIEKIDKSKLDVEILNSMFNQIDGFEKSYLIPQILGEELSLRRKMNSKDISLYAYSGQPYFQIGHQKNGKLVTLFPVLYMYITLFALGSLCRYYPETWSPFVKDDTTGEKLLIEKFLYYSRRMVPNYLLNYIYNKNIIYTNKKYSITNTIKLVGEHEVKELIKSELHQMKLHEEVKSHVFKG